MVNIVNTNVPSLAIALLWSCPSLKSCLSSYIQNIWYLILHNLYIVLIMLFLTMIKRSYPKSSRSQAENTSYSHHASKDRETLMVELRGYKAEREKEIETRKNIDQELKATSGLVQSKVFLFRTVRVIIYRGDIIYFFILYYLWNAFTVVCTWCDSDKNRALFTVSYFTTVLCFCTVPRYWEVVVLGCSPLRFFSFFILVSSNSQSLALHLFPY